MDYFSSLNASALDPDTPTLFELLSAKELDELICPSLRFIVTFYAQRHPRYLLRLATRFDEIYGIAMALVEYYHLRKWNASFTEKFYGLKRTNLLNTAAPRAQRSVPDLVEARRRLTKRQVLWSLALIVAVPYIKEKLDVRYERLRGQALLTDIETQRKRFFESDRARVVSDRVQFELDYWFYKLYPLVKSAHHLATLLFYLGYLFGKTTSHSVGDYLLGMKYSRMSSYDYMLDDQRTQALKQQLADNNDDDADKPLIGKVIDFVTTTKGINTIQSTTLTGLSYALPTSMFLLKFLEWWSGSDVAHRLASKSRGVTEEDLPIPSRAASEQQATVSKTTDEKEVTSYEKSGDGNAPALLTASSSTIVRDTGLCPLCGDPITNPTVIESGVVFCYPCIYKHLETADRTTGGHCPVTGQRLLQCRFSEESEEWEVGGLRRLMI